MFKQRSVELPCAETFFLKLGLNTVVVTVRLVSIYIKCIARG
jgi:hypothetical protein